MSSSSYGDRRHKNGENRCPPTATPQTATAGRAKLIAAAAYYNNILLSSYSRCDVNIYAPREVNTVVTVHIMRANIILMPF